MIQYETNAYQIDYNFGNHCFLTGDPPHNATAPSGAEPLHCRGFTITLRHTTIGRTPLNE